MRKFSRPVVITAISVVLVFVTITAIYFAPVLRVKTFDVEGESNLGADEIIQTTEIVEGDNILRVDTGAAAHRIAKLPWIKSVTVSRSLPATLKILVEEHQPVGVVKDGATPALINKDGKIFLQGVNHDEAVPFENTKIDDRPAIQGAATAVSALDKDTRAKLRKVEAPDAEAITLFFEITPPKREDEPEPAPVVKTIRWGSAERAAEKAEATRIVLTRGENNWNVANPALPTARG